MCLRDVQDDDHQFLVDLHNDPVVLRNLTNPNPISLNDHLAWWESVRFNPHEKRLVFTVDRKRVGFTKFYQIDFINQNCVLGADIHRDHRGKGLAKHMWSEMLSYCFESLQLHRVSLMTAEYNVIGQHVYQKLGFKEEGRLKETLYRDGTYHDGICMYMLRDDYDRMETSDG
jgi:RimJ/RimL family protein N-acetyltransferase